MNRKLKLEELNRVSVSEFKNQDKIRMRIILDNIRSMNNVGSVFRTSDAFNLDQILLCGVTATPPHRDIRKTAIGAEESMDWIYFESTIEAVEQCKSEGYTIVSIEQTENSLMLDEYTPNSGEKIAVVVGNEVTGVDQRVIDESNIVVEIPQFGTKHSLNVSVCTGVVVWDLLQKVT